MVSSLPSSQWKTVEVRSLIFFFATGLRMRLSDSPAENPDIFIEIFMTCSW